jgi:hypothetical protein
VTIYLQFMSLNDIKLSSFLTAEMYKDALIETTDLDCQLADKNQSPCQDVESKPAEKSWKILGDFQKKILMIVQYENAAHIPDVDLNFLTGILTACKLSIADIGILNLSNAPSSLHKSVNEKFQAAVIIFFGVSPKQFEMPIDFPEFQVQPFNNCTFLFVPTIDEISKDQLLKSKLWVSLRKVFGI